MNKTSMYTTTLNSFLALGISKKTNFLSVGTKSFADLTLTHIKIDDSDRKIKLNFGKGLLHSLVPQTVTFPVMRGRRGGDMNPNRGIRTGRPSLVPQRYRYFRHT